MTPPTTTPHGSPSSPGSVRPPAPGATSLRRRSRWRLRAGVAATAGVVVSVAGAAALTGSGTPEDVDATQGDLSGRLVTAEDLDEPAVARLDPDLLVAVQQATRAAADDGIALRLTSGWRSVDYQRRLWDEAIETYGRQEAERRVDTPGASAHNTGDAVDLGPTDGAYWVAQHGADFGLCQVYANEIWHYELLASPGGTCPAPRADASS